MSNVQVPLHNAYSEEFKRLEVVDDTQVASGYLEVQFWGAKWRVYFTDRIISAEPSSDCCEKKSKYLPTAYCFGCGEPYRFNGHYYFDVSVFTANKDGWKNLDGVLEYLNYCEMNEYDIMVEPTYMYQKLVELNNRYFSELQPHWYYDATT